MIVTAALTRKERILPPCLEAFRLSSKVAAIEVRIPCPSLAR